MASIELLIPVKKLARRSGVFTWPRQAVLAGPRAGDALPLGQLADGLKGRLGVRARVELNACGPATVRIVRDAGARNPEAYRLTIRKDGIEAAAGGDAGAYYAIQTLRDLVRGGGRSIPACEIEDTPDFPRRGVYHDCSRGKVPTVATLKGLIERLGHWKINELQLYIENVFTWRKHPAIGRDYSPFTPEEIIEIQEHCKRHHVKFVGSLASFGHMEKVLMLPEYYRLGERKGPKGQGGGGTLCPGDSGSIRLVEDLYGEFLPLLEAADFNICGDETWELGQGRSKARAEKLGIGRVYLDFLLKIHKLCRKHGKRMNAWADIVLKHAEIIGDVPKDIVMLNWDYAPAGNRIPRSREIVAAGLPWVACPGTNAWNSFGCRLSMGMKNIAAFAEEGVKRKAEGLLNTDWGDGGHMNSLAISLHNFAYGAAHSWNHAGVVDRGFTEIFAKRTFGMDGRLAESIQTLGGANEALGVPYGNSLPMYRCFRPSIEKNLKDNVGQGRPLTFSTEGKLADYAASLAKLRWPAAGKLNDRFDRDRLAEFEVATETEALAAWRVAMLKKLMAGKAPTAAELKKLSQFTRTLLPKFQRVWLRANKPSRLKDVVTSMQNAIREYGKLGR